MGKYLLAFGLVGILALTQTGIASAQDSREKQSSNGRRIAMVLPKAPAPAMPVVRALPVQVKTNFASVKPSIDPIAEFASHPQISTATTKKQMPENIRLVLIDGAAKAEQLSRSYNRRVADVIVWLANSMNQSSTISPGASPNLHKPNYFQTQSNPRTEALLPID